MEKYERKNKELTKNSKIKIQGSSHIEVKVIGGDVDLDLLSLFPQELAGIIVGIGS